MPDKEDFRGERMKSLEEIKEVLQRHKEEIKESYEG